ncbi:unnamed protein product [Tuber aestivum]|uniref:Uncharacterized protein n=1 Tax=Tuber aestivum TaxID=59557 RepID=A0A292PT70_9PEZI|nr:unnamed protein product [Tuber aestivum]
MPNSEPILRKGSVKQSTINGPHHYPLNFGRSTRRRPQPNYHHLKTVTIEASEYTNVGTTSSGVPVFARRATPVFHGNVRFRSSLLISNGHRFCHNPRILPEYEWAVSSAYSRAPREQAQMKANSMLFENVRAKLQNKDQTGANPTIRAARRKKGRRGSSQMSSSVRKINLWPEILLRGRNKGKIMRKSRLAKKQRASYAGSLRVVRDA